MNTQTFANVALGGMLTCLGAGCDDVDWPEPQIVDSLRVLGVRAEPPTLTPGASTRLSLHCVDGSRGAGEEPNCNAEVAWFAGCNNPEGNEPKKCFGQYAQWTNSLASPIAETPTAAYPEGFGFGMNFEFAAPPAIFSETLESSGVTSRYGTSFIYFAVCNGQLVPASGTAERLPISCRERSSGKSLDQRSFVVGVTAVYSYESFTSANPVLLRPQFDGVAFPESCSAAAQCPARFECSTDGQCVPVVGPCTPDEAGSCTEHCLTFDVTLDSFSLFELNGARLAAPLKSLWLDYFTNAGSLDDESVALHPSTDDAGVQRSECKRWQAPSSSTEHAHLWAVVRDNRGGLATWDQRIIVR